MTATPCMDRSTRVTATASRPLILRLLNQIVSANARYRQHQALLRLDDGLLRDIGLTRHEAESQPIQRIWDAPSHWRG